MHSLLAIRRLGSVAALCGLWALAAPVRAASAVPAAPAVTASATPFDRELGERRARFTQESQKAQSPAAVVPLLGLAELWERVADRDALIRFAQAAAAPQAGVSPLVRAHAQRELRTLLYHQAGETPADKAPGDAATALAQELGEVTTFAVLGPFDNDGRRGHAAVYPPEQETAAPTESASYDGKQPSQPPRWRPIPATSIARDGTVPLDAWLRPESQGTAYAAVYVKSPSVQRIAVRTGSTGAIKVWVNRGAPVIDRDTYHPLRADQEAGGAVLGAGWNRVLVKVSSTEGSWGFTLRLTAPDGRALPGMVTSASPPSPGWAIPRTNAYTGAPPEQLLRRLQARVDSLRLPKTGAPSAQLAAQRAQALSDLGQYLSHLRPFEAEQREDESALAEAVALAPSPRACLQLVRATGEVNDKRKAIEAGLALPVRAGEAADETSRAQLFFELGRVYEEGQRERQALAAYGDALKAQPALYTAALEIAQLRAGQGLVAEGLRQVDALRAQPWQPALPLRVLRVQADLLAREGRARDAEARYREILAQSRDDQESLRQLVARARARGDVDEALRLLDRCQAVQPEVVWPLRERAEILEGAGKLTESLARIDAAMSQLGNDPEWNERRGRLLTRLERTEPAAAAYRRALELRPQNPTLRQYLAHLDPQARSGDDLARRFRVDVPELLGKPRPKAVAGDPARVLLDNKVTRVHANGLSEVFVERVIEISDERGGSEYSEYEIRYTPDTQSVQVKSARVYKKSGAVQEAGAPEEDNVSEPWYGLYYDVHAQTLRFDGLAPGDVIAVEYVLADVGRQNLLADYFGDLHFMQEDVPRLDSRYALILPEADFKRRPLYFNDLTRAAVKIERSDETTAAGERIIRFRAAAVPRLSTEPGMPGFAEIAPYIHVSTYRSWEDVATWYQGLIAEQLLPSAEIAKAARDAVAGIPASDEPARLRAIYNLVVKRTRYVGLEFGIHGYKPYKVSQVFQRKFGDCKDKASLLKVLLKEVGIDSTLVLARTRRNGAISHEPASLAVFDHAIVYVPKYDLYLDGTAEFSGSPELPSQDQDIMVLLVSDPRAPWGGRGHLAQTPVLPAAQSVVTRRLDVRLDDAGTAHVADELRVAGQSAARWREHYQSSGSQKERYEKAWNEIYPGAKAVRVELPGLGDLEKPVSLRGELDVPGWGKPQAGAQEGAASGRSGRPDLVLKPLGRDPELLRGFARLSQRKFDLILGYPWTNVEEVTVRLPARSAVRRLPAERTIESPFGRFVLTVEHRPGTPAVTVRAELRVDRHRVSREEYAAFRRFCTDVDSAVAQELVVGRE